jgi:heme-degrading monooxygenase HmoA
MSKTEYAKYNRVHFRSSEDREMGINTFIEFFKSIKEEEGKEMNGHIILRSMSEPQEAIVLTFWKTKHDMDRFYSGENRSLANLVEKVKPLFEKMPERTDYAVSELLFVRG